ncbi:ABC transporter ATP-binding protein [Paenibacillus flagellatus]|uniref:ABC transporter ATP-binding protein n=1 Tax=Paenibacillus flagellatus TaxID=2211139 RepID=A0A2V5KF06_9BACL|nr:ATP-binding cassette domain-containing protein [Paenibacillus flagellatus]PYI52640.1 ABC transporter ATP-binding protein [Paenibacillus flagellatus]
MRLEGIGLGYRYGRGPWILRNVDIAVEAGEIVGLIGPSGRGKSTLGRLLAGYDKPEEGVVRLNGKPLPAEGYSPVQLVFQHPEKAVNPRMRMRGILNEGWKPDRAFRASLGIADEWLDRFPHELSGGELQRFCVARALGPATRFLIADEMTTMLDAITQAQIWHAVLDIARERRLGLLVVSHERSLVQRLCSRVIELA